MRVTADGDSSMILIQTVPYGPLIQKIECANHACKAYRSSLEKLAKDHPQFTGKGRLTKRVCARMATRMHSRTGKV